MIFKITKDTELYTKLQALQQRIVSANNASNDLCKAITGRKGEVFIAPKYIAGGIDAIKFTTPPDMAIWKHIGPKENEMYFPRERCVQTINLIGTLPRVMWKDLNEILNYRGNQVVLTKKGPLIIRGAQFGLVNNEMIIKIHPKTRYTPIADMEPLTEEEFNTLSQQ